MRLPTYFISHGGGPWPWLDGPFRRQFDRLEASLAQIAGEAGKPRAVLMISGHWEAERPTVQSGERPGMVYDYSGFPEHTYSIKYGAPGSPAVAKRVKELLEAAGIPAALDPERGFDHGTFAPLQAMYPEADVPVVQLSLKSGYDPEEHLAIGRALAPLRDEGVFIVGSGMTYHNLRAFGPRMAPIAEAFDAWLREAATADPGERDRQLADWANAPMARQAHPREEHLLPLMVIAGAAGADLGRVAYGGTFAGMRLSAYHFG